MNTKEINTSRPVLLGIIGSFFLAAVKFVTGFFGNSYALIADAIESTTDIFSSFLVLLGLKYAAKPADENHPYGHGRIEPLITFIVVAFLVTAAITIFWQSLQKIQTPHALPKPYTLIVLVVIILIKEVLFRFTNKKSQETQSTALKAEAWHHRSDAITSMFAALGIGIALIFGEGFEIADDIAAMASSFFIIYNAFLIFRPALGEIMDEHMHHELEDVIRKKSLEVNGVLDIDKCFIRKIGMDYIVDLHMIVDGNIPVTEGHFISHQLKDHLIEEISGISNVNIHVEPFRRAYSK